MIFLGDFSFVKIFLKNYCVTMTTTLNTSRSENTMVLSARVSACMYFLVTVGLEPESDTVIQILKIKTCISVRFQSS